MTFNAGAGRRSLRLKNYDYALGGAYFVTLCTQDRSCLFGHVVDDVMRPNDAGRMMERWVDELPNKFPTVECDAFVCMPNHIHLIVSLIGDTYSAPYLGLNLTATPDLGAHPGAPLRGTGTQDASDSDQPVGADLRVCPAPVSLSTVVQWFKTMTTNEYIRGVKAQRWSPFSGRLWQRNYYEHIVRDAHSLDRIRDYIANNPLQWAVDRENPANFSPGAH